MSDTYQDFSIILSLVQSKMFYNNGIISTLIYRYLFILPILISTFSDCPFNLRLRHTTSNSNVFHTI